jgi:hypothetical protein
LILGYTSWRKSNNSKKLEAKILELEKEKGRVTEVPIQKEEMV